MGIKPFTVVKPVTYIDTIPMIAHQNTKIIRSPQVVKCKTIPLYQPLGLDVELVTKTEQDVLDVKSLIDFLALRKYNPLYLALFSWTTSPVTVNGYPSFRNHEMKLVYNPNRSSTKEVEIEVSMIMAYLKQNQNPKALSLLIQNNQPLQIQAQELQAANQQHQQLQQALQNLNIEQGLGLTSKININLRGGAPKTFTYVMTAGHGQGGMEQKWNIHLENKEFMSICVDGSMSLPLVPLRKVDSIRSTDIRYAYRNTIGFGRTCQEHTVKITGSSAVSLQQQQRAQQSQASRICEQATQRVEQLKEELQRVQRQTVQNQQIKERLVLQVQEKIRACRQQLAQLTTLDHITFQIEYSPITEETSHEETMRYARNSFPVRTGLNRLPLHLQRWFSGHSDTCSYGSDSGCHHRTNTEPPSAPPKTSGLTYARHSYPITDNLTRRALHCGRCGSVRSAVEVWSSLWKVLFVVGVLGAIVLAI